MSELDELYMTRRLAIVGRAQDLTPSMQFDLASSSLSNGELEEAAGHFNPKPQNDDGWGFANVFEELLSRDPRQVPVNDLATLQENLKKQGYLPSDHPADGVWGPDSYAAFNQFDRDNADSVRQGNSLTSGSIWDGLNVFSTMLPRSVFQGVIGTAKGLVEQTGETLERSGALGSAAVGAGIGTAIAPGIGTAVGAVGGFVGGFLMSLLGDDEDKDEGILDALHPFNRGEWTTGKNFFEDLGYVASAASLIRGGKLAIGGAKTLAPSTLRGSVLALDPVTKPGFVANMLNSARGSAAIGAFAGGAHGLMTGDDFGDVFEQAAIGGVGGLAIGASPVGAKLRQLAAQYGLKRVATNPVVRGINKVYTGGVVANVGGRYTGGIGSGEKETALEKNIREAPVVIPGWADAIGGMVLLPERILPLSLREIGTAARSAAGETRLFPYFHALETARDAVGKPLRKKDVDAALDLLRNDPVPDLYMREQFGIQQLTKWSMDSKKMEGNDFFLSGGTEGLYREAHNDVMRWYKDDPASKYPLVMALSTEEPLEYASYLTKLESRGSGIRSWTKYEPAQLQAETLALQARAGKIEFNVKGGSVTTLDESIARTERQIARLEAVPEKKPSLEKNLRDQIDKLAELKLKRSAVRTKEDVTFVAASPDYMTAGDWSNAADEYMRLVGQRDRAWNAAREMDEALPQARTARASAVVANEELETFVRSFRDPKNPHRYLPEPVVDDALGAVMVGRKGTERLKFADFLKEKAAHAGADVEIDPSLTKTIRDNGYKLVATGDDLRFLSEVRQLATAHNVGDYTRRASFFEAAGLSPFAHTEKEVGRLKQAHLQGTLNEAATELGLPLSGDEMASKLLRQMEKFNTASPEPIGPFVVQPGDEALARRMKLLRVDLRQLKLDDIVEGLKLDEGLTKVPDPLRAAQVVKDAIHKGSVFGAEVSLKNPSDSVRMLASAMRVEGLTGFSDFMRQFHITNPPRALAVGAGVAGAGVGYQEDGLEGALKGGIAASLTVGAAGYGGKKALSHWPSKSPFKPGTYGWLPNNLHNAAMALRYSLSFTFDLGRRMEQAQIASMEFGLPVILAPKSYARRHLAEDFGGVDNVMTGLRGQLDEVMGSKIAMNADDMDRRAAAVGLTGFSQRDADAVYAHLMIKQGKMKPMAVRDAVHKLGHYPARTGFERSLNFVLFPFSFQKKLLTTLGDFMMAEPARALIVHEGMRQWHRAREDGSISEKVAAFNEKYLPMAETIARLNNLSYGLSPGRFFMEGFLKNKTLLGNIQQGLASVFVPSGAVTPLQQAAGKVGDSLVNFTSPIFLTGEDTENFAGIFEDFAPAVRDFRGIFLGYGDNKPSVISQQITAVTERGTDNGGGAPWYQLRNFQNERRAIKAEYEDLATAFGYETVDGFLNSDMGAQYKLEVEQKTLDLTNKYPTGAMKSQYFENSTLIDEKAKAELIARPDRTPGEEMIVQLMEMENETEMMAETLSLDSQDLLPRLTEQLRTIATQWSDDVRFRELWDRWFKYRYGPITEVLVA